MKYGDIAGQERPGNGPTTKWLLITEQYGKAVELKLCNLKAEWTSSRPDPRQSKRSMRADCDWELRGSKACY